MIRMLILLLVPLSLFAIEAKVQLVVDTNQDFFVSKRITVLLKVMSTGFKISNLEVDYSNNKNFVIVAPKSASYMESVDGFSVVVYEYNMYPLKSSTIELKPWSVSFDSSLGYGMKEKHFTKKTSSKSLNIATIEGYDFLLATPSLSVQTIFSSKESLFKVGEAIERRVIIKATDVVDLLIPSLNTSKIDGITIYSDEAKLLEERGGNGELISTRIENETYLLNRDGNFTIAQEQLYWYNTSTKKVHKATIEGFSFSVIAPVLPKKEPKESNRFEIKYLLYIFITILILSYLFYRVWFDIKDRKRVKKRPRSILIKSINPQERVK